MPTPTNPNEVPNYEPPISGAEPPIGRHVDADAQAAGRWQRLFDQLSQWRSDPDSLADDENIPPSEQIFQLATDMALKLERDGLPCPDSVVADPSGGIAFEYGPRDAAVVFHVWDDGAMERLEFRDTKLINGRSIHRVSAGFSA